MFTSVNKNIHTKQHDVAELITKGKHYKLRCTSKVSFSMFENSDAVKDVVTRENTSVVSFALEWVHI